MSTTQFSKPLIYMLIASAFILALSLGVRHSFGLYLVPMSHEFGWGHHVFSLAIAMQNLIWGQFSLLQVPLQINMEVKLLWPLEVHYTPLA